MRPDPPVWLLALWLGPEHGKGAAVPLLRQEGHQVHHQMAGVPSAARRVQTPLQDAYGGATEAHPLPLCLVAAAAASSNSSNASTGQRYHDNEAEGRIHVFLSGRAGALGS